MCIYNDIYIYTIIYTLAHICHGMILKDYNAAFTSWLMWLDEGAAIEDQIIFFSIFLRTMGRVKGRLSCHVHWLWVLELYLHILHADLLTLFTSICRILHLILIFVHDCSSRSFWPTQNYFSHFILSQTMEINHEQHRSRVTERWAPATKPLYQVPQFWQLVEDSAEHLSTACNIK